MRFILRLSSLVAVALGLFGLVASVANASPGPLVLVARIDGAINPITERYVGRVLDDAEQRGATAVVFSIDTPGGLIDSTYKITARFLAARVPVVTFVSPPGARAASAGTFITMAGHVAAMAPTTNIGAAHPVDSSGGDIQGDLRLKAENDAVAHIVNIARARGRNEQWAEDAVRRSVSVRDDEAAKIGVVDLIANDVTDLLNKIDGKTVTTAAGQVTLATYGIIFELSNPSLIFPGIIGVIAVVLALFAFGTLDANATGVALMILAIVLFVAEIKIASHFLLTAGGLVSLVLGTIILFPPLRPTFPGLRADVDPVVIATVALLSAVFFFFVARFALSTRQLAWAGGSPVLIGAAGVAKSDIGPSGVAYVAGEEWSARSDSGPIAKGSPVRVKRKEGLSLIVES